MKPRLMAALIIPVLCCACAPGVDVDPLLRDFDTYANDVRAAAADEESLKILDIAGAKRAEAGALADEGKDKEAARVLERAMADARLAFEMEKMHASSHRAEKCRFEVDQARVKWSEAVSILEQVEESTGGKSDLEMREPVVVPAEPALPPSTLASDSFPPVSLKVIHARWTAWRTVLNERKIAAADLETEYWHSYDRTDDEKKNPATAEHHLYLAARAAQSLECRVRYEMNERVCLDATLQTAAFADARVDALRAALDLERGLKDGRRKK